MRHQVCTWILKNNATPIVVWVERAKPLMMCHHVLPDALADPLQEIRVASSTAQSYFVKKSEYIQIIDVDGRQMTDFQCFSAQKLDKGIERPLDVTTTRSFMTNSFPIPRMHSKYFDQDWDALVEVVQDTVGRHDAFTMACTAKYFDDVGYPGHANCSINFNFALKSYPIEPRPGWMAANFFYNTFIGANASVMSDKSWSRPGDYVLMRALTDLVCVIVLSK
ncbi:MAG: aminomethyltransferase [Paracoccaceae bacterium]